MRRNAQSKAPWQTLAASVPAPNYTHRSELNGQLLNEVITCAVVPALALAGLGVGDAVACLEDIPQTVIDLIADCHGCAVFPPCSSNDTVAINRACVSPPPHRESQPSRGPC